MKKENIVVRSVRLHSVCKEVRPAKSNKVFCTVILNHFPLTFYTTHSTPFLLFHSAPPLMRKSVV